MELKPQGTVASQKEKINLIALVKSDPELKEFIRLIHEYDLREKAVEALSRRLALRIASN